MQLSNHIVRWNLMIFELSLYQEYTYLIRLHLRMLMITNDNDLLTLLLLERLESYRNKFVKTHTHTHTGTYTTQQMSIPVQHWRIMFIKAKK